MRKALLAVALILILLPGARAQFGSFSDVPVDVDAGQTRFVEGMAIAEEDVSIRYGDVSIYADYAQYNTETRDVFVRGNVRIYRDGQVFVGERAVYNLETKQLRAADFSGGEDRFFFTAQNLYSVGARDIKVQNATFTTSDSSQPDYYLRAKSMRIYPKDRIIFSRVTLYIGKTPVFWWPYLYQSLKEDNAFTITPGYQSRWGAFVLTKYHFPLGENLNAHIRLDLRSKRGVGVGFGVDYESKRGTQESWGQFRAYYAADSSPNTNKTDLPRDQQDSGRYRIAYQSQIYFTDEFYALIDINKLSDENFLEDYEMGLFRLDPQPDNVIALTKWDENFTLTAIVRAQLNDFFTTTERLPEVALDIKRRPIFGGALFYESETSAANLRRSGAAGADLPDYDAVRLDTFHQILYPRTYMGWLSIIPRAGVRGTWYSNSGRITRTEIATTDPITGVTRINTLTALEEGGSVFRGVLNAGIEASFKFWKEYEAVQSRTWGLDGLRHVVQPYTDLSFVYSSKDPDGILQFDRLLPSTQLPPTGFPQFNTIDSISDWSIWRLGVRNRFQTRRDDRTINWLEIDTYFNLYIDEPSYAGITVSEGTFSNVFNRLRWEPLPWMSLTIDSQLPLLDSGFTEINTSLGLLVNRDLSLSLSHRYIDGNPFFNNSNQVSFGAYYRIDDNWGFSLRETYEFDDNRLQTQVYQLHRDLSSWVASLGVVIRDNGDSNEFGLLLSFTLKDLPNINIPLAIDPQGQGGEGL